MLFKKKENKGSLSFWWVPEIPTLPRRQTDVEFTATLVHRGREKVQGNWGTAQWIKSGH